MLITLCTPQGTEQCELDEENTLADLKGIIYSLTNIAPTNQIIEGVKTGDDTNTLGSLCEDDFLVVSVMDANQPLVNNEPEISSPPPYTDQDEALARMLQEEQHPPISSDVSTMESNGNLNSTSSRRSKQDEDLLDILRKMKARNDFHSKFGIEIEFSSNPIVSMLRRSSRNKKPLLVYPYYPQHSSTISFCENILATSGFAEFVNENFISWAAEMDDELAILLDEICGIKEYPCLLVLGELEGVQASIQIANVQGIKDPDQLIVELLSASDHFNRLVEISEQPVQISEYQQLMQKQNQEFEESLKKDQEKERIREEEELAKQIAEMELKEEEERIELEKQAKLEDLLSSLPPEPQEGEKNITKLNIRLPNGKRLERRFNETDTLQIVKNYILSKADESGFSDSNFQLITPFPRLVHENLNSTLKDNHLIGRAVLVAELCL